MEAGFVNACGETESYLKKVAQTGFCFTIADPNVDVRLIQDFESFVEYGILYEGTVTDGTVDQEAWLKEHIRYRDYARRKTWMVLREGETSGDVFDDLGYRLMVGDLPWKGGILADGWLPCGASGLRLGEQDEEAMLIIGTSCIEEIEEDIRLFKIALAHMPEPPRILTHEEVKRALDWYYDNLNNLPDQEEVEEPDDEDEDDGGGSPEGGPEGDPGGSIEGGGWRLG